MLIAGVVLCELCCGIECILPAHWSIFCVMCSRQNNFLVFAHLLNFIFVLYERTFIYIYIKHKREEQPNKYI